MKRYFLFLLFSLFVLSSCDDLFDPAIENFKDLDLMYEDPIYAQGILTSAYRYLPDAYDNIEYATSDAVTNNRDNGYLKMATGAWSASNNPVDMWVKGYGAIQSINTFIERCNDVPWAKDPEANELFRLRLRGEAFGLRAVYHYYLLRNHAGYSAGGELLGVPLLTEFQDADADFNTPRASFKECVDQIMSDLDSAVLYLPIEYNDVASIEAVPDKYKDIVTLSSTYNRVMGNFSKQLLDGQIARAFRSRVAMLAASPAFQDGGVSTTWEDAANYSAEVLNHIGGVSGLAANGGTYYANIEELDNLSEGINPDEILWRTNISTSTSGQQEDNYPPSLFGRGRMNPTQNLVEAFPDIDGYPISNSSSVYNSAIPFANRDPRLAQYIVYNGSVMQVSGSPIYTGSESGTVDGININETSTRTGYYMKKRMRMDVNKDNQGDAWQGKSNYTPRIRYTEMFLNYAEAANEAYGPMGTSTEASYSAYDVVKAIRARAGVGVLNGDAYLESIKEDKDAMRTLIRNERRIELCFEGFRFWDLRRWGADLTEVAKGYDASTGEIFNVENRSYADYMNYGPIPYSEILKYDELIQNRGW